MVRKIWVFLICLFLILGNQAYAASSAIFDGANIISESAKTSIKTDMASLEKDYQVPIVIYTTDENINNAEERADSLLADQVGIDKDGLLLYINMNTGDYHVTYSGRVIRMISDQRLESIKSTLLNNLKNSDFDKAAMDFVRESGDYIKGGELSDIKVKERQGLSAEDAATAGAGGLGAFILSYFGLKKTSVPKASALIYSLMDNTESNFSRLEDAFIATRTTSRIIPRTTGAFGSGKGHSSTTHRGSGGGTFGGGGGKFK